MTGEYHTTNLERFIMLRKHYDVIGTVSTIGVFLILSPPWPLWAALGVLATWQAVGKWQARHP